MAIFCVTVVGAFFYVIFCCYCIVVSAENCNFNVRVNRAFLNEGFHRNISYGIVFDMKYDQGGLLQDCVVGVDQLLPKGVFANPDELGDLKRLNRLNAIPNQRINVELPAEESQPTSVYLMGRVVDDESQLWLPVHARYHRARAGGGVVVNEIQPPKLYLRCPDQRLDSCGFPTARFLCDVGSREECSWKMIPFDMQTATLKWEVPVGNTDHYYIVSSGTAAIVALGAFYLLTTTHKHKILINKKNS